MLRNRIVYILAVLVCVGFSMLYKGRVSAILLFTVLLYPVLAFGMTVWQLFGANARFCCKRAALPKDILFELGIEVSNRFIFPAVPFELKCVLPDEDLGLIADKRLFVSLPPFGKAEVPVKCRHRFRGNCTCKIERVYVVDPLRIIRVSKKYRAEIPITFLPRNLELEDILFKSAVEQSVVQKQLNTADEDEFSHVREYRDGDIFQMVHWKLTAKQDELMIKQFDSVNDLRDVVLCDYHQQNDEAGMVRADMVIETALAFVRTALDKGIHSTVSFCGINSEPLFVNDEGSWGRFYDLACVMPPDLETEDFAAVIDRVDKSAAAILILITDSLSEEFIERARNAAQQVTVFYAYLNLSGKPLEEDFSDERFMFLNIIGTHENALKNASAQLAIDN